MKKVVQFSGGKDSIVCLHLFKDVGDVQAIYINTGCAFPRVSDFVAETCEEFGVPLIVARPENSVSDWHKRMVFRLISSRGTRRHSCKRCRRPTSVRHSFHTRPVARKTSGTR